MQSPCDSLGIDRTVSDVLYVLNEKESRLRLCEFGWMRQRFTPTVLKQFVYLSLKLPGASSYDEVDEKRPLRRHHQSYILNIDENARRATDFPYLY
jgi:hypothetical protein